MGDLDKVVRILKDKTHGIKFNFTAPSGLRVRVDYSTFFRVAEAIEDGRITVDFDTSHIAGNVDGIYVATNSQVMHSGELRTISGVLHLREINNLFMEGTVVHESVHASLDLTHNPHLMALENEAAAYIAQGLFFKNLNFFPATNRSAEGLMMETARTIPFSPTNGNEISTAAVKQLINAINQVGCYRGRMNTVYESNG